MSILLNILSTLLLLSGLVFFLAGSLGLLRFSNGYSRLHAVTKADTLGLGLVVLGLAVQASWRESLLMIIIWLLVMASGAVAYFHAWRSPNNIQADQLITSMPITQ